MSPVCENCTHWQNGECEVKLGDSRTSANHECDEVMFLFDFALGQGPTLFFEPNKYTDEKMKSKRAEEYIEDNVHDAADLVDRDGCGWAVVGRHKAYHAVELAEEDMAEKAAKAFCFCKCGIGPCIMQQVGRDECKDLREFKQKLME